MKHTMHGNCPLCGDLKGDPDVSGILRLYGPGALSKAILWQSHEFYLTPAPGTIVPGYLLLSPKEHVFSYAALSSRSLFTVERLVGEFLSVAQAEGMPEYVVFEHGAVGDSYRGAACVDHAHLHLAPCPFPHSFRIVLRETFKEYRLDNLAELKSFGGSCPYILLSLVDGTYVYETPSVVSQYMRRILAAQHSVHACWNWQKHPFRENFWETIRIFETKFDCVYERSIGRLDDWSSSS